MLRLCLAAGLALITTAAQADLTGTLKKGKVDLKSAGPLAFGPDGVLFVSDPIEATVYAVDTGEPSGNPNAVKYDVKNIDAKLAAALGTKQENVNVVDVAVNPASGIAYLSVRRGNGPNSSPFLVKIKPDGELVEVKLDGVKHAKATLPNAPANRVRRRRGRSFNLRSQSVTDLAYVDGRVFVAGMSNEEFASKLRSIPFPFKNIDNGTSVEIYHGAHGAFETRSPVRTFTTYKIGGKQHLLAGYQCTPLVKFPVSDLKAGSKLKGTTIAELGNRNRPLDMFVYKKGGKDYILMANSARGVMKITTQGIATIDGIEERIRGTAGLKYETIGDLKGVKQLDRLNADHALVLLETETGPHDLRSISLP